MDAILRIEVPMYGVTHSVSEDYIITYRPVNDVSSLQS